MDVLKTNARSPIYC